MVFMEVKRFALEQLEIFSNLDLTMALIGEKRPWIFLI